MKLVDANKLYIGRTNPPHVINDRQAFVRYFMYTSRPLGWQKITKYLRSLGYKRVYSYTFDV